MESLLQSICSNLAPYSWLFLCGQETSLEKCFFMEQNKYVSTALFTPGLLRKLTWSLWYSILAPDCNFTVGLGEVLL